MPSRSCSFIHTIIMSGLLPPMLFGCEAPGAVGLVVDEAGRPVAGARVAALGCEATTDPEGRYTLSCAPGEAALHFEREGFLPADRVVEIEEDADSELGSTLLLSIPALPGLHLLQEEGWSKLSAAELRRLQLREGPESRRAFCLHPGSGQPTLVAPGTLTLFDQQHPGWRPFRLDGEGCAWRETKSAREQWSVDYRGRAPYTEREVGEGAHIATLDVEEGDYFFADWKGFFVATPDGADPPAYGGSWLRVVAPAAASR